VVIEVVAWEGAGKTHVVRQDHPTRTLCGRSIPGADAKVWRHATVDNEAGRDDFPTCAICSLALMLS
jgi:hypothetical protein